MKRSMLPGLLWLPAGNVFAQLDTLRIPYGQPDMLTFAPDARIWALGYAGAALSADANATYINASRLATAENDFGASVSYMPWLRNLVKGMCAGYTTAYKKLGPNQVIAASVQHYNYSEIWSGVDDRRSSDLAVSASYARNLSQHFSMGFTMKYITSDLGATLLYGVPVQKGQAVAGDISAFYKKQNRNEVTGRDFSWSVGAILSDFGGKISYGGAGEYFLPTRLRVGTGISYTSNGIHRINLVADANKLLVPTPTSPNTYATPYLQGIVRSFSDAPGGFREEMQEVTIGLGAEYWFKDLIALRAGYYHENEMKGNNKLLTFGAGARIWKKFQADLAFVVPTDPENALRGTYRATVSCYLPGKRG